MNELVSANALYVRGEFEEAANIYLRLAWEGDLDAMFNMGYLHQFGIGVEADAKKAADFYYAALYLDGGDAAYNLAVMTMNGSGVPRDIAKAMRIMERAAENGCPEAQLYLATAYSVGYAGNPTVSNICRIPFHKAEKRYDYFQLGGALSEEEENAIENERVSAVTGNEIDAHRLLSMAASNEDENDIYGETIRDAKYLLGLFHIEGIGCPINRRLGESLIRDAARLGSDDARKYLLDAKK